MRTGCGILLALWLGGGATAWGQDQAAATIAEARIAPVTIDGTKLFSVRGVTAHPATERASQIEGRIRAVAANPKISAQSVTIEEHPGSTWILADGQRIMAVFDEDAALEEVGRELLAELYDRQIVNAIERYRQDRRPGYVWPRVGYALLLTVALAAAARILRRLVKLLHASLEKRYRDRVHGLEHRALHLVREEQVWRGLSGFLTIAWGVSLAAMVYAYLSHVLALFPWTRGFGNSLFSIAIDPLRTMGSGLIATIPNIVFLAILVVVTRFAMRMVRAVFDGVAAGSVTVAGFDPDWAVPTYRLVRLLMVALALVVAYPYIPGSESGAFKGISLFMGVIFSLGSSSLIGNFIAGYSMTYRRTFRVGDRVKIGDQVGEVEQVRLLVTRLRTVKNEEVIVPNSTILGAEVINYSSMARDRGLILHTTVGIGYETPWQQVEAILLEAAARTSGLSTELKPFVLPKDLGDFAVTYELNVYCNHTSGLERIYGELHKNVLDVFHECGVQIMTPAYEGDPSEAKVPPESGWSMPRPQRPETVATAGMGFPTRD